MKCELCNGKGVINDADAHYGVRHCPKCDAGNLQLRLDHKFQPVIEEDVQLLQQIEAWGREPNPIYQDMPFMPLQASEQKFSHELEKPHPNCQQQMIRDGRPHPSTCSVCKLGPCKWFVKPHEVNMFLKHLPELPVVEPPTAVQDRDAAIAQVHAEFAKAGLCIVPVDVLRKAWNATSDILVANMLEPYIPKE